MVELLINQTQERPRLKAVEDNKLLHYINQAHRAVEVVFVDETVIRNPIEVLLGEQHSKYERVVAGLYLVSRLMPSLVKSNIRKDFDYSQDKMPFNPNVYVLKEKIGSGGANDVFLLSAQENGLPSYALKVCHASREAQNTEKIVQMAREQRAEYQRIAFAYKAIDDLIPREHYFIAHGPRAGEPVSVMLQVFIGEDMKDVFKDISKDEFVDLLRNNGFLNRQLAGFITATESNPALIENDLDLLGKNNLVVAGDKGEERLILLDPHFISVGCRSPETRSEIVRRFNYLKEISESSQR